MTDSVKIMPNSSPQGPMVAALAYDGLCTFEFGIAYEVFGLPISGIGGITTWRDAAEFLVLGAG
ncbi:hypothetical protein ACCS78_31740, partial [Rhizobium johnstonii]